MDINYYKKYEPFFGSWRINEEIGKGNHSKVFRIEKEDLSGTYSSALKVISVPLERAHFLSEKASLGEEYAVEYLKYEVTEITKLFHDMMRLKKSRNIVNIEDFAVVERTDDFGYEIFVLMEQLTNINVYFQGDVPREYDVIKLGIDICKALEHAQKFNLEHKHVAPSNIFISNDREYKLSDFGITHFIDMHTSFMPRETKPYYMAPEMYKGEKYDSTVDIYSLGLIMYYLLNVPNNLFQFEGTELYAPGYYEEFLRRINGEPLREPANASNELSRIILKSCSYESAMRYETPAHMREALERLW